MGRFDSHLNNLMQGPFKRRLANSSQTKNWLRQPRQKGRLGSRSCIMIDARKLCNQCIKDQERRQAEWGCSYLARLSWISVSILTSNSTMDILIIKTYRFKFSLLKQLGLKLLRINLLIGFNNFIYAKNVQ